MKLYAKKIKRHKLKTYKYWQLNLRILVIAEDQLDKLEQYSKKLPKTDSGYLAFAYLDEYVRVAFLGTCNDESGEYEFFDKNKIFTIPASEIAEVQVRLVKLNRELADNAFVQQVMLQQANNVLPMSTLTIRALDPSRDPERPFRLRAYYLEDKERAEELIELQDERQKALDEAEAKAAEAAKKAKKAKKADKEKMLEKAEEAEEAVEDVYEEESLKPEIDIAAELEELTTEVWLRNLSPANNNSWRAELESDLEGSDLKAGDLIHVELRFTEDEEGNEIAVPFVDPEAEVEDVAIEVTSHQPTRLPWRKAYELECENCDFHETYYLGRNGEDARLFNKIIDDVRKGRLDPAMYLDLVQKDDVELDFSRELYRCRHCGNLNVTRRLRMLTPESTKSEPYYCPHCGERTSGVKRVHIATLNCPKCFTPLHLQPEKVWYASEDEDDSIMLEE